MNKLKLNLDDLAIDSFQATPETGVRGTALGYATLHFNCTGPSDCGSCFTTTDASGDRSCEINCTMDGGYTCMDWPSCGQDCAFSDATNCHRCTTNQSDPSYCTCYHTGQFDCP